MDYDALRAEQAALRAKNIHRGIGIASFIEVTNPSAAFYGVGGAKISSQDGVAVRLDAQGSVICQTSITEQGQGSESLTAQIVGSVLGVSMDRVRVILGDTDNTPYGGGTWASRGAGIGGEAALQATKVLRKNILDVAAAILQSTPGELDIVNNSVVNAGDGAPRIELSELARIVYFRPDTLPPGIQPELMATRHFVPREYPFAFTNGVQASWLEVDTDTGFVKLLKHWVVEDCGTIINPQLVDEQIRGGVVQGLGAALFEKCVYDERGQLTNANMADYLVPMSGEMPDIDVGHVVSPTLEIGTGCQGRRRSRHGRCGGGRDQRGQRRAQAVWDDNHGDSADASGCPDCAGPYLNRRSERCVAVHSAAAFATALALPVGNHHLDSIVHALACVS